MGEKPLQQDFYRRAGRRSWGSKNLKHQAGERELHCVSTKTEGAIHEGWRGRQPQGSGAVLGTTVTLSPEMMKAESLCPSPPQDTMEQMKMD